MPLQWLFPLLLIVPSAPYGWCCPSLWFPCTHVHWAGGTLCGSLQLAPCGCVLSDTQFYAFCLGLRISVLSYPSPIAWELQAVSRGSQGALRDRCLGQPNVQDLKTVVAYVSLHLLVVSGRKTMLSSPILARSGSPFPMGTFPTVRVCVRALLGPNWSGWCIS